MEGFTFHNIRLDDGRETLPEQGRQMKDYPPARHLIPLLKWVFPEGLHAKKIVDLGCLEGGYATEFARLGMESYGIEVRKSNFDNCMFVKQNVNLPNLHFIHDDAWNCNAYGPYDVIFCCGLYYHMAEPKRFFEEMAKGCKKMLFLETHFAPDRDDAYVFKQHKLSPLCFHEGQVGRWIKEHFLDPVQHFDQLDNLKWASWKNQDSFWLTKPALLHMMKESGFDFVMECYENDYNISREISPQGYVDKESRSMFVGIRTKT